jgi:uncharacterized membrane protein HdeD (DUF308 family)
LVLLNPIVGAISFVIFTGIAFLLNGLLQAFMTFKAHDKSLGAWFKVVIVLITGVVLLLYPISGVAAMALLFSVYFFVDAFASFSMALDLKPLKGWGMALFNGILSFLLGVMMLVGWPATSLILVGIVVGVSFLFDGFVLIYLGILAKKGHYN